jgi:hypothetical protein
MHVFQHDAKLVGAPPRYRVDVPNTVPQTLGDNSQQFIAGFMPERAVDGFEIVHADEHDSCRLFHSVTSQCAGEAVFEQVAIGEIRHRIELGRLFKLTIRSVELLPLRPDGPRTDRYKERGLSPTLTKQSCAPCFN